MEKEELFQLVQIKRFRRSKRLRLHIQENGPLLTAPKHTSLKKIQQFILSHQDWIEENLAVVQLRYACFQLQERDSRKFFLSRGIWKEVREEEGDYSWVHIKEVGGGIDVGYPKHLKQRGELEARLREWCGEQTLKKAQIIIDNLQGIRVLPQKITLSKNKKRWGSCSSRKILTFHPRLYQLDPIALHYVVIHECAHLVHLNHSSRFWAEVARLMPNYKQGQRALSNRDFGSI